jgi:S-layer protein (TIGR01567 family)
MTKKIMAVVLAVLMLLTIALPASAAVQVSTLKVRGQVFSAPEDNNATLSWDAQSFAGFFYDLKDNKKTEYLNISGPNLSQLNVSRSIADKNLTYATGKAMVDFKVYEKETLKVINNSEFYGAQYPIVGWRAEKWIAVKGNANKLTKLAFEMGKEDKKTLTSGETWALGSGYELTINAVDARASPRQVWFSLKKDGALIDDGISSEKNVYYKTQTIMGESDSLLFAVYVDRIFSGSASDMAQFKYAWLTDAGSAMQIETSDTFDAFKVKEAGQNSIVLENDGAVSLSKNTNVKLLGNIGFEIADSNELRFYPYVEYTTPGTYEMRGRVFSNDTDTGLVNWSAQSFAGFFYDIKNNKKTEYLNISETIEQLNGTRSIADKNLTYATGKAMVDFKVYEKETLKVINNSEFYGAQYPIVGWRAEKWIAVKGNANKLTKLAFEMGKEDKKTLTSGETWALGSGYELTINAVDARASPRQVWFSLKKDGALIDDGISSEKNVYYKTQTIMGESDSLLFAVYVDRIFSGSASDMAQFKYAWLTDASSAMQIETSDTFDAFKVKEAGQNSIVLENDGAVSLSKNTDVKLLGDMGFKIADSDTLRFYPKVDYIVGNETTPSGTGTATVKGTAKATTNVTSNKTVEPTLPPTVKPTEQATTKPTTAPTTVPGFEAAFAIAGLLAVAYIVLRQRK